MVAQLKKNVTIFGVRKNTTMHNKLNLMKIMLFYILINNEDPGKILAEKKIASNFPYIQIRVFKF